MLKGIYPDQEKVRKLFYQLMDILETEKCNESESITLAVWVATFVLLDIAHKHKLDINKMIPIFYDMLRHNMAVKETGSTIH